MAVVPASSRTLNPNSFSLAVFLSLLLVVSSASVIDDDELSGVKHRKVRVNGINMHVAEKGQGPVILFLHGFPELWYSWRHQIGHFADLGYRAVAPDLRGYGDTDAPAGPSNYTCLKVVDDVVALIDSLHQGPVFVVAHDWGAIIAWYLCLFRPDLVKAYVALAVQFMPRNPEMKPVERLRAAFGDDYYVCRYQEPGKIESQMTDAKAVMKNVFTIRKTGPLILPKENPFGSNTTIKLPPWLSQHNLDYYASIYQKTGFTGGLNYYRALDLNWELTGKWTGAKVNVPVKFVVGDLDITYTTPGVKEYVQGGAFKRDVPRLEGTIVFKDTGHFINQERAPEINDIVHDFIAKFK